MARKPKAPAPPPTLASLDKPGETFEMYGMPYVSHRPDKPSVINYVVLRRYRVTIELIDEPVEVLRARLIDLAETTSFNIHLWDGMRAYATALGIELKYEQFGCRAPKKKAW